MTRKTQTDKRRARHRSGLRAEWLALAYLTFKAYRLIAWRYKTPVGEIDLILRRGRRLIFVEVKARKTHDDAAFALHRTNQQRVVRAAQYFIAQHPSYADYEMRFDLCSVAWYSWPQHRTNAFGQDQ